MNTKQNKYSYRFRDHLNALKKAVNGDCSSRSFSHSGNEGRFDMIYHFHLGENVYLGLRIKHDDVEETENQINFYAVRYLNKKSDRTFHSRYTYKYKNQIPPMFNSSKNLSGEEFKMIMKTIIHKSSQESVIDYLNETNIFDFDLNVLLLSDEDFKKELKKHVSDNEKIFQDVCNKLESLNVSLVEEDEKNDKKIKEEQERLNEDQEYLDLLNKQKEIEALLKEKETKLTSLKSDGFNLKTKIKLVKHYDVKKKDIESSTRSSEEEKEHQMKVVIQDMIYFGYFKEFDNNEFPQLPEKDGDKKDFLLFMKK